jgi:FkbM family methyltransferase
MHFAVPNWLCRHRVETFSTKEPETLEWIDAIPDGSVLWDVGANIGLYSIYAAKHRNCRVYAFEPSVFNLELLARNLYLNDLQQRVTIVPVALSDALGTNLFRMSSTQWGGALSTFGQDFGQDGEPLAKVFEYQTLGISMTDAVNRLGVPVPRFLKIDVDGIEHFILRGGADVLRQVDGVLTEINDDFVAQADECARHLSVAGLTLHRKCTLGAGRQFNQWWRRPQADSRPA